MTQYTEYKDYGSFQDFSYEYVGDTLILHANYVLGAIDAIQWRFYANEARLDYQYHFGGVVDEVDGSPFRFVEHYSHIVARNAHHKEQYGGEGAEEDDECGVASHGAVHNPHYDGVYDERHAE